MGLLFLKTSPVKQYSYANDFSAVFDALHQSFRVVFVIIYHFDHLCEERRADHLL